MRVASYCLFSMILNSLLTYCHHKGKMKYISKLKKSILSSIVIISGGMLSSVSMAHAYDGQITFHGKISAATCEISGGNTNGTETNSSDFVVTLPTISSMAFKSVGEKAGDTDFFIKLKGDNCKPGNGYAIKFERISSNGFIDANTGYLKNTNTTEAGAKNVQLVISDENKNPFDFTTTNDTSPTKNRGENDTETIFNFGVQYVSTAASVTGGEVEGNIYYSVVYP